MAALRLIEDNSLPGFPKLIDAGKLPKGE